MYSPSTACADYLNTALSRSLCAKLVCGDKTVTDGFFKIKITQRSQVEDAFSFGATCAAQVEIEMTPPPFFIEGQEFSLFFGVLLPDGSVEYLPMGIYTAEHPEKTKRIKFTAFDRMMSFGELPFFSELSYPTTADKVLAELCSQMGVPFALEKSNGITIDTKPEGYTRREVLGYIATLYGGFACFDREGGLRIGGYSSTPYSVDFDKTSEPAVEEYNFILKGIQCAVDNETTMSAGNVEGGGAVTLSDPLMTQAVLNALFSEYKDFTYRAGTLSLLLGDPRLDPWDVLEVTWDGESYLVPCMELTYTFDGGLSATVQAFAKSDLESSTDFKSPLTQAMNRTYTELLLVKKAIANQITIEYLDANYAKIDDLEVVNARIDNITSTNITVEYLDANYAKIDYLEANYAKIDDLKAINIAVVNLDADVANINQLLAGQAGVGELQAIHITADNTVIDDAIIKDAMIVSLTADKITSGTVYTNKVTVASESGNLYIADSTIQIIDNNDTVRVQIGEDAQGDYNYYLWDSDGNLMWNATGVTEHGLNDGIIKDINVADDAAINGSKLDITSVAERLNEDGSITVDASNVKIDNTTLSVAYKTITQKESDLESDLETLETEFEAIQGKISSKIWQTDIDDAVNEIGEEITTINDKYATLIQTVDGIQSTVGDLQTVTSDHEQTISSVQSSISQTAAEIELKVEKDGVISAINQSAESITIDAAKINLKGAVTADCISVTDIYSIGATIGGWSMTAGKIYGGDSTSGVAVMQKPGGASGTATHVFAAGGANHDDYSDCPFRVTKSGKLYATSAEISGKITATSGTIGGFAIGSAKLYAGAESGNMIAMQTSGTWAFAAGANSHDSYADAAFRVSHAGSLYATKGKIGDLTLTDGAVKAVNSDASKTLVLRNVQSTEASAILYFDDYSSGSHIYPWRFNGDGSFRIGSITSMDGASGKNMDVRIASALFVDYGIELFGEANETGQPYIDFHYKQNYSNATDYTSRIMGETAYTISFIPSSDDTRKIQMLVEPSGELRVVLRPDTSGDGYLGTTSYRWNTGFFTNTITQSDLKTKNVLGGIDNAVDFIKNLTPISYTLKDGDSKKRIHMGFGAQDIAKLATTLNMGDLAMYQAAVSNADGTESYFDGAV
ncbi:MAG: tail fiber domain-containing protein, partial [Lachnospiraceae bacterium]